MYNDKKLIVVKGSKPSLLGRDWADITLDWQKVFKVECGVEKKNVKALLDKYSCVFSPSSDGIKGLRAHISLKPNVTCVFQQPRPVPNAMCESVDAEYNRLIAAKILEPVSNSDWGTPTVCVQKPTCRVRICGDYKRVNEFIEEDSYDLPNVQELLTKLAER